MSLISRRKIINRIDFIIRTFMARAKVQTTDFDPEQLMNDLSNAWDRLEMEVESMTNTDAYGEDEVEDCSSEKVQMGFHQPKVKAKGPKSEDDDPELDDDDEEIDTTIVCKKVPKTLKLGTKEKTPKKSSQE